MMKQISVIITTHNEGEEVLRTVESVIENTNSLREILVIDEASTDGSCDGLPGPTKIIRHRERVGIALSRQEGAESADGDTVFFLDAHQRLSKGAFDQLREIARDHMAIAGPEIWGLTSNKLRGYGGEFRLHDRGNAGYFTYNMKRKQPRDKISRCTHLCVPGYGFPKELLPKLSWIKGLRLWGGTEVSLVLKAFFTDIDILNVQGVRAWHLFRAGKGFPYPQKMNWIWRNQYVIAKTLFHPFTYRNHWKPTFERLWRRPIDNIEIINTPEFKKEAEEFREIKVRPDREFWRGILRIEEPECLKPKI